MSKVFTGSSRYCVAVCALVLMVAGSAAIRSAQDKAPSQAAGVDNTKMGPYPALAQLSFQAFQTIRTCNMSRTTSAKPRLVIASCGR